MGLSCGNPAAIATLEAGKVALHHGCGGFDVFIVAQKVGPRGRAIGIDMTSEMITRARRNAEEFRRRMKLDNVEFRLGEIEHLPVADSSVDVVISNCVINLSPDKPQVWREIARVLKPGGRVAISDVALLKPLPPRAQKSVEALVGCVAGAALLDDIRAMAEAAGLQDVQLTTKRDYVESLLNGDTGFVRRLTRLLPKGTCLADYVASVNLSARKPALQVERRSGCCRR